jgi:hypothetical protein
MMPHQNKKNTGHLRHRCDFAKDGWFGHKGATGYGKESYPRQDDDIACDHKDSQPSSHQQQLVGSWVQEGPEGGLLTKKTSHKPIHTIAKRSNCKDQQGKTQEVFDQEDRKKWG